MEEGQEGTQKRVKVQGKVFNDPIHGHVELHPLLIKIIDTPQFQRLRNIKQLGGTYFVYPGASHNRFEHSIGVAHLAGKLARALKENGAAIDDRDILCVEIAGLCHDLGHGPFSHLFDDIFIPMVFEKKQQEIKSGTFQEEEKKKREKEIKQLKSWTHEEGTCLMLDDLALTKEMEQYGLKLPEDLIFIKELIKPPKPEDRKGRGGEKAFLYEIVSNKENGVDVDKFDYLARDCYHLGLRNNFDHNRFIMFARVCKDDKGKNHISIRDKMQDNMLDLFHTRYCIHKRACHHRVNFIIQRMIAEAFLKADGHIQVEGSKKGEMFTLSTAIGDMKAYVKLTDHVFEQILNSSTEELKDAREILERIISRRLYKFLGETKNQPEIIDWKEDSEAAMAQRSRWKEELAKAEESELTADDFVVDVVTFDYGQGKKNPVKHVYFYSKDKPEEAILMPDDQATRISNMCIFKTLIRVYCKTEGREEMATEHFKKWINQSSNPQDGNAANQEHGDQ